MITTALTEKLENQTVIEPTKQIKIDFFNIIQNYERLENFAIQTLY